MKHNLLIFFFLIVLPGTSTAQDSDSLIVQKWLEDNNIYEGCKTRIDSIKAETNGLKILMKKYQTEIDSINNFNSQLTSSMHQVQVDKIVLDVQRKFNSEIYAEPQSGLFITGLENQSRNWIYIPENKSYILSSEEISICSCLEKTKSMSNSKILKYLTRKRIQKKLEKIIHSSNTVQITENQNRLSKTTISDSFFPRIEYLFTKQNCLQIKITDDDEYQVTVLTKEII